MNDAFVTPKGAAATSVATRPSTVKTTTVYKTRMTTLRHVSSPPAATTTTTKWSRTTTASKSRKPAYSWLDGVELDMRLVDASRNRRVRNNGAVFVDDPLLIGITALSNGSLFVLLLPRFALLFRQKTLAGLIK